MKTRTVPLFRRVVVRVARDIDVERGPRRAPASPMKVSSDPRDYPAPTRDGVRATAYVTIVDSADGEKFAAYFAGGDGRELVGPLFDEAWVALRFADGLNRLAA